MSNIQLDNCIVLLADEIDKLTNHFVFDGYNALAALLKAPLASMIVLYIILKGYAITRGIIKQPQQELFNLACRSGLIYMLGMHWDFFALYMRDLFVVGSESIASTLMQAVNKQFFAGSINQGLQAVLNDLLKLGSSLFEAGSIRKLTPYFAGIMVFLSGSITLGLAFIEIVIAKLMLAVCLCTAPVFMLFTLFEQTKSFFERWLGILSGFSFVLIFVSSVVGLCIHLLHWVTISLTTNAAPLTAAIWVPIFIVACLCIMGIREASCIGKSIGGAVCTSHGAAMVGGFIGASLGSMAFSKNTLQKPIPIMRKGLEATSNLFKKGREMASSGHSRFKQLQKNLRGSNS